MKDRQAELLTGKTISRIHSDWALLVSQEHRLADNDFRAEALAYAMQLMSRFRGWLHSRVESLHRDGYDFVFPDRVLVEPDPAAEDWIGEFRQKGVHFSVALEAWLRQVGGANLVGSNPSWPTAGYAYENTSSGAEPLYTDPLVVELPHDYAVYLYDEWLDTCDQQAEKEPFRLEIAPDHLHKANISGGLPYQLSTDRPHVDGILWNERHGVTFIGYLRLAIKWSGFPGFDYIEDPLKSKLLEATSKLI